MSYEKTAKVLTGRTQIFSSVSKFEKNNICAVIKKAYETHKFNKSDIDFLFNYYKGQQPILKRVKLIRPEINNKIVENHAFEIVDFKKGYVFGEPVQYVQRGICNLHETNDTDGENDNKIIALNELMANDDKASKDCELAENFFICGTGYRMILPTEVGDPDAFNTYVLNTANTFVIYSNNFKKEPILCCTYYINSSDELVFNVYSNTTYWLINGGENGDNYTIVDTSPNGLGLLPIIEYPANPSRLGAFEIVISLLDSMNNVASNRIDGIEQFIQSIIWFSNCDIDEEQFKLLGSMGAIKTKSEQGVPANITILNQALDQMQTQKVVDYMYQTILTITGVPDRNASAGGNTGQALVIGQGWAMAESNAKATELSFKRSEKQLLKAMLKILENTNLIKDNLKDINISDIEIKFTRNRTDNMLTKTQGLLNQLESGIHPRIAISTTGIYSDPEQVYSDSKDFMEKWKIQKQTQANNNPQTES